MKGMQHRRTLSAFLLAVLTLSACDSGEDQITELTDNEQLTGTWAIVGFLDATGDRSDIVANGFAGIHLEFGDDGKGAFEIFPKEVPARRLTTSYIVDEELDFISMTIGAPIDALLSLELSYVLETDAQRVRFHSTDVDVLNTIFESDLAGDVVVLASKFGEEGITE